jgi:hypothetical protein
MASKDESKRIMRATGENMKRAQIMTLKVQHTTRNVCQREGGGSGQQKVAKMGGP